MRERGLVEPDRLRSLFDEIGPTLFRYPTIDPANFRAKALPTADTSRRPRRLSSTRSTSGHPVGDVVYFPDQDRRLEQGDRPTEAAHSRVP